LPLNVNKEDKNEKYWNVGSALVKAERKVKAEEFKNVQF
jgi:hypothetical protein